MMDAQAVFDRVCALTGISEDALMPFCENAAAVISAKMKADASASDIRLLTAAAAVAYCGYTLMLSASDGDIASLKAGDVTVTAGGGSAAASAENFKIAAIADAAELLVDGGFSFRTV